MRMMLLPLAAALSACTSPSPGDPADGSPPLDYSAMAAEIASALEPASGERALVRYDAEVLAALPRELERALVERGVEVDLLPYGPAADFARRLDRADIYVWLPTWVVPPHPADQQASLGQWLDVGRGRQIHFHWGGGTIAADGLPGEHGAAYDAVYERALSVDYQALADAQDAAIAVLRSGIVRVVTPAGTDIAFRVGDRPFNKQNGDASNARMTSARTRIDREIELPAGVIRVAPIETSVAGTLVISRARFGDTLVENLRIEFERGVIVRLAATSGERAVRDALAAEGALEHFREFGLGFNEALVAPEGAEWLPYYGYGAGVVRMSLGNNLEVGGAVGGAGVRWLFFRDATVTVGDAVVVDRGQLALGR